MTSVPRCIGLVGCVKEKRSIPCAARDLYTSTLFAGRRRDVERSCDQWWILSAQHGLIQPSQTLAPYDLALKGQTRAALRSWAAWVLTTFDTFVDAAPGDLIEFHAGAEYRDFGLAAGLQQRGLVVVNPTQGLSFGQQLAFYSRGEG